MTFPYPKLGLALADAAKACERHDATAIVTLKSGVQLSGRLEKEGHRPDVRYMKTETGWIAFDAGEIVAVEARRR